MTYLHLTRPEVRRLVCDEAACPVSLYTCDHIVAAALDTLRDDTEAMVFENSGAADSAQEALLDAALEFDDSDARGRLRDAVRVMMIQEPKRSIP